MQRLLLRARALLHDATKPLGLAAVGALTIGILRTARYFDPIRTANLFGWIARSIGPMMREQKIGRVNLTAAFPEKSPPEIEAILAGVWDNLVASAPNSHTSIISGSTIPRAPRIAGSKSGRAPTNCLRSCDSTANRR